MGFEAVLFMAERGFKFIPCNKEGRPALKWSGENRNNFTTESEKLLAWSGTGYRRFMYLPGLSKFIGLDIDRGHAGGKDRLRGFYNVTEALAGKPMERLPSHLRDLPSNFPCYTSTPSGGLHLLFKYDGPCRVLNLNTGEYSLEIRYLNSCLSLGETSEGSDILYGDPVDAPDLPPFLAELINPRPNEQPRRTAYRARTAS
jgi:hypothetical protein